MNDSEFVDQAVEIAARISTLPDRAHIPAACRGSGNPATLSWLAEGLQLDRQSIVIDIGAGIGGPAAWLSERYGATVIAAEPSMRVCGAAVDLFGLHSVCADAEALPFLESAFDACLLLGVCSVVANPRTVLAEARRIARRVAVLDYCATDGHPMLAGGSRFVSSADLIDSLQSAGWRIVQISDVVSPAPVAWSEAAERADVEPNDGEIEVGDAIAAGRLVPVMIVASRDDVTATRNRSAPA